MAIGDDALAAGMRLTPGTVLANTIDSEINRALDYIAQKTSAVMPVAKGGTGATTASGARDNLGASNKASTTVVGSAVGAAGHGLVAVEESSQTLKRVTGALNDGYIPSTLGGNRVIGGGLTVGSDIAIGGSGDITGNAVVRGHVYVPNATNVISGYTVAYINSDGRLGRSPSSERYKKHISAIDPEALGDVWPVLTRYQMRQGDGSWKYGYIADRMAEHPDQEPFVVYDLDGRPDSIDHIALLMVQNAQLHQAVQILADRIIALEERA